MVRIKYKVRIPTEVIVRGNKFLEAHPSVEIEDYPRALAEFFWKRNVDLI